jgi:hypothetical protein
MSEPTLEQVKKLAAQLLPEDRLQLFHFISDLPDSGIASGQIDPPSPLLSPEDKKTVEESATLNDPIIVYTETYASIFLKGRPIFTLYFYPENYRQSRMEIPSWKDAEPTDRVKAELRRALELGGQKDTTEEEITEAVKRSLLDVFEAQTTGLSRAISALLPKLIELLFFGGLTVVELRHTNAFADQSGQRKKTLDEMVKALEPFWRQIKGLLYLSPGGRQNLKHKWSPTDYVCLEVHYERLKPIWREAKKAARVARNSKEPTRQKRWKEAVAAIYQEENLPSDLIERLIPPEDMPPADLALIHAGRLCVPGVSYSLKVLKEKLSYLKKGVRAATKTNENEGSSSGGE